MQTPTRGQQIARWNGRDIEQWLKTRGYRLYKMSYYYVVESKFNTMNFANRQVLLNWIASQR